MERRPGRRLDGLTPQPGHSLGEIGRTEGPGRVALNSSPLRARDHMEVKLEEGVVDTGLVPRRRRLKVSLHDPAWRSDVAFRLGIPIVGIVVAVVFALLITRF
jgi:hypothetical protein